MAKLIDLATPHMSDEGYELEYINDAFRKNWIAPLGENVTQFEKAIASYLGYPNTVALCSGTAALHLSMILAGVGRGDLVFCQDLTFSASANPIKYLGAEPVFIDSEQDTWNMDPVALERAFSIYRKPRAVVVVHLYGSPAKMKEISDICEHYNVPIIEDAAEAFGSTYSGQFCGTFSKYGVLSFNGNKIITTSGGGMLLCQEKEDADHALKLATQAREPFPWYYHEEVGYNYRLSNICAGIGRGQMKVLPQRIEKKAAIYKRYSEKLSGLPVTIQPSLDNAVSNRWLTSILINEDVKMTPADLLAAMRKENIHGRHLWNPMHVQPVFADAGYVTASDKSVSSDLFSRGVCLPSDTKISMDDVDRICETIRNQF